METLAFKNKIPNIKKLLDFGFIKVQNKYQFKTDILNGDFSLTVTVSKGGEIITKTIDKSTDEIYTLHLTNLSSGAYVGKLKEEYENFLNKISDKCFDMDVFKSPHSKEVIKYVQEKYKSEPEFLWEKFTNNAVLRRKDTNKWYGILIILPKNKIIPNAKGQVEILDLRAEPNTVIEITDNKKIFPGYHMNKKHWITIPLDGSVPIDEIFSLLDTSYKLATK